MAILFARNQVPCLTQTLLVEIQLILVTYSEKPFHLSRNSTLPFTTRLSRTFSTTYSSSSSTTSSTFFLFCFFPAVAASLSSVEKKKKGGQSFLWKFLNIQKIKQVKLENRHYEAEQNKHKQWYFTSRGSCIKRKINYSGFYLKEGRPRSKRSVCQH